MEAHATVLMHWEICFSKYGFMHGKEMNPDHLSVSFLLMCLWQLTGQYLTGVCVFSVKKEKDYVQALLRMQSQVLWVKKCCIYSHPCSTKPFPCVSNVTLPSFDYSVTHGGFLRAPGSGRAQEC